jgi:hypothetical protein
MIPINATHSLGVQAELFEDIFANDPHRRLTASRVLNPEPPVAIERRPIRSAEDMREGLDASHFTFKFIILGDTSVGKSCIISRYRDNQFTTTHDVTIGVTFTNQTVNIGTA